MDHYLEQSSTYRSTWPEPDVTLEMLRKVLYAFFEVKEQPKELPREDELGKAVRNFALPIPGDDHSASMSTGMQLTKEETDAWIAAGMPSPFEGWVVRFRHERGRRSSSTGS